MPGGHLCRRLRRTTRWRRTRHQGGKMRLSSSRQSVALLLGVAASSMVLVGCGGGGSGGTTTLQWYGPPDSAGATDLVVKQCNQQSNGAYRLVNNPLPSTADGQREQLVRRMAAKDSSVDLMTV